MEWTTHFAIVLYIAEICVFCVLMVVAHLLARREGSRTLFMLCLIMFVRMVVKLLYFYVEFYISGWALNVFINLAMDTTYVLSMFWYMRLLAERFGVVLRFKPLLKAASFLFVFGFFAISLAAVDRSSNHLIVIQGPMAQGLYALNEMFYLLVASLVLLSFLPQCRREGMQEAGWLRAAALLGWLYVVWVFLWNVSFVFPAIEPLRRTKPIDGVHVFAFLLLVLLGILYGRRLQGLLQPSPPVAAPPPPLDEEAAQAALLECFAVEHSLTPREREVLTLAYEGKSSAQIAGELCISLNTTKRHLYNLYRKCGVNSKYDLIYKINHFAPEGRPHAVQ